MEGKDAIKVPHFSLAELYQLGYSFQDETLRVLLSVKVKDLHVMMCVHSPLPGQLSDKFKILNLAMLAFLGVEIDQFAFGLFPSYITDNLFQQSALNMAGLVMPAEDVPADLAVLKVREMFLKLLAFVAVPAVVSMQGS